MFCEPTISKQYKYRPLKSYIGLEGRIPIKNKDVFVGIEIELENVTSYLEIGTRHYTEDHSLKVHGAEFVTIPIKMRYLEVELRRILGGFTNSTPTVSARCSTHVHVNVRDMTTNQIVTLVMLYMIFERSLYRMSGDRWNNNFCVPLCMSLKPVKAFFENWDKNYFWSWYKYMGLNLSPIWGGESTMIGTVEFRQMKGSTSVEEIVQWCNMVTTLKRAAQSIDQDELLAHIRTMNTTSGYAWLAKEVFGSHSKHLTNQPTFVTDVENCIMILKSCIPDERLGYTQKVVKKAKAEVKKAISTDDAMLNTLFGTIQPPPSLFDF